eukprot:CAMPEP_0170554530 /NCGR_PEP_ID=MMETSP0211-20121228/12384_1 /TAXON_ID=311385 /ORGANISM="Pseudokeronopsis sp., Strain OXSARD2" /LENGTH=76 /DNA_ID=CAMNT_0010863657 /DNA_START=1452 /DNA_END=1679 /DNA_ORIENTATION=+
MLDRDGNGRITKDDLAEVFKNSPEIGSDVLDEMIAEADELNKGDIAFKEFKKMMIQIQQQSDVFKSQLVNYHNIFS